MTAFRDAIAWATEDGAEGSVGADWGQGRALFGGVVAALMRRAMRSVVPEDRVLRALHVAFVGAVAPDERARVAVRVLRSGKSATTVEARLVAPDDGDAVRTTAFATFGAPRPSEVVVTPPRRPEELPVEEAMRLPFIDGVTPVFTRHFALRWARGGFPFSSSETASFAGYCGFAEDAGPLDDEALLCIVDAWPSPALQRLSTPSPASSITWTFRSFGAPGEHRADDVYLFVCDTQHAADGYVQQAGVLYAPDGTPLADSSQTQAIFG